MYKKKIIVSIVIIISLGFLVGGHFLNKRYHQKIKSCPKMYVYQTYFGPANSVLIVESVKHKENLISYYETIEKSPESNPPIGVPLKTLPQNEPVYVIGYTEDSLLALVVSYYDYGALRGGSFTKGWVYAKCLHQAPPPKKEAKN
jgi:hypothetical protein